MGAIAGIVSGLDQGFKEYGEGVRRQKAMDREDKRFKFEEDEQAERQRVRDANKAFSTEIKALNEARANGQLPGSDDNVIEQPPAPAPTAIAAPGAAPAPAAAEPPRTQNIFKSGGEGLYKDQKLADDAYYKRLYDVTANYLSATGQSDKVLGLQKQITEMKEQGYEPLRKAAAAAVAMGHPNAMQLVAKASKLSGTPTDIDPASGVFDKDTQMWKGVKITGADGKTQVQDIPAQNLLVGIGAMDAGRALEFTYGLADTAARRKIEQQKADADTIRARSSAAVAADNAKTNAATRAYNEEARRRGADRADDESAAKFFGSAFGLKEIEPKTDKELEALMPDQIKAYADARVEQSKRREKALAAQNLYSLNERRLSPAFIAQSLPVIEQRIAKGGVSDGVDQETGLPFMMVNGKKILLRKD